MLALNYVNYISQTSVNNSMPYATHIFKFINYKL